MEAYNTIRYASMCVYVDDPALFLSIVEHSSAFPIFKPAFHMGGGTEAHQNNVHLHLHKGNLIQNSL